LGGNESIFKVSLKIKKGFIALGIVASLVMSLNVPVFTVTEEFPRMTAEEKQAYQEFLNNEQAKHSLKTGKIDVKNASNDELKAYGILPRPTDSKELTNWMKIFGNIKEAVPVTLKVTDVYNTSWTFNRTSANWAGAVNADTALVQGAYNQVGYQNVTGTFIVPDLSQHTQLPTGVSGFFYPWVGLGGGENPNTSLIQDGIGCFRSSGGSYLYSAWWENYSLVPTITVNGQQQANPYYESPSVEIQGLSINPGDSVTVTTSMWPGDNTTMAFIVINNTTGDYVDVIMPTYNAQVVDNSMAEWIGEQPGWYEPAFLANYGTINWTGCSYGYGDGATTTWYEMPGLTWDYNRINTSYTEGITMYNNGLVDQSISQPGNDYESFSTSWQHYNYGGN